MRRCQFYPRGSRNLEYSSISEPHAPTGRVACGSHSRYFRCPITVYFELSSGPLYLAPYLLERVSRRKITFLEPVRNRTFRSSRRRIAKCLRCLRLLRRRFAGNPSIQPGGSGSHRIRFLMAAYGIGTSASRRKPAEIFRNAIRFTRLRNSKKKGRGGPILNRWYSCAIRRVDTHFAVGLRNSIIIGIFLPSPRRFPGKLQVILPIAGKLRQSYGFENSRWRIGAS